jgi:hypothetical protein
MFVFLVQTQIGHVMNVWLSEKGANNYLRKCEEEGYTGLVVLKMPIADCNNQFNGSPRTLGDAVFSMFPKGSISHDNYGQIVVYTGFKDDDDVLTEFVDGEDDGA